jgi:hypothetical protein
MTQCDVFKEYITDTKQDLQELQHLADTLGTDCEQFHEKLHELEIFLKKVYKKAVLCTARQDNLQLIKSVWEEMMQLCKMLHDYLLHLNSRDPHCCAESHSNLIIDYYNEVKKRYHDICEEIECQEIPFPKL